MHFEDAALRQAAQEAILKINPQSAAIREIAGGEQCFPDKGAKVVRRCSNRCPLLLADRVSSLDGDMGRVPYDSY